jgi:hypothetical protein
LTIVAECNNADTGVGATIAPKSHDWNGSCADLTNPAQQINIIPTVNTPATVGPIEISCEIETVPAEFTIKIIPMAKKRPPSEFSHKALFALI